MTAIEAAQEAALEIEAAIAKVNRKYPKVFARWPLELSVMADGQIYTFEFTDLIRKPKQNEKTI